MRRQLRRSFHLDLNLDLCPDLNLNLNLKVELQLFVTLLHSLSVALAFDSCLLTFEFPGPSLLLPSVWAGEWAAELWSTIGQTPQVLLPDAPVRMIRVLITRVPRFGLLTWSLAIGYPELASDGTPTEGMLPPAAGPGAGH